MKFLSRLWRQNRRLCIAFLVSIPKKMMGAGLPRIRASHTSDASTKRGWWWWLLRIRVLLTRSGYSAIRSIKVSWAHSASIPIDSDYSGHEGGHQIPSLPDKASVRHPWIPRARALMISRVAELSQARNARPSVGEKFANETMGCTCKIISRE